MCIHEYFRNILVGMFFLSSICNGCRSVGHEVVNPPAKALSSKTIIATDHVLVLLQDGSIVSWGCNEFGQLGDGTTQAKDIPVRVVGINNAISVSAKMHSVALLKDGTIMVWGLNNEGQLGNGTKENLLLPTKVKDISNVIDIAVGGGYTLALLADGTIISWGRNQQGELGNGTVENSSKPVRIKGISDAIAISAGALHNVALLSDGTVMTWGVMWGGDEEIEDIPGKKQPIPIKVKGISDVKAIAAGGTHTLVLLSDGSIMAWGINTFGQLGDGTLETRFTPVKVKEISNAVAIAAGATHSVALLADGTVMTWGKNESGELGDVFSAEEKNISYSSIPLKVKGVSGAIKIAADCGEITLVLLKDGAIMGWGSNKVAQLGEGIRAQVSTKPVNIFNINKADDILKPKTETDQRRKIVDLIQDLKSSNVDIKYGAVDALKRMGIKYVMPYLVESLKDKDVQTRLAILFAFSELRDFKETKDIIPDIIKCLDDNDKDVRCKAIKTLAELKAKESIPEIIKKLKSDESSWVRGKSADALGELNAQEAIPDLIQCLKEDEDIGVMGSIIWALGKKLDAKESAPVMVELIKNNKLDKDLRNRVIGILKEWKIEMPEEHSGNVAPNSETPKDGN